MLIKVPTLKGWSRLKSEPKIRSAFEDFRNLYSQAGRLLREGMSLSRKSILGEAIGGRRQFLPSLKMVKRNAANRDWRHILNVMHYAAGPSRLMDAPWKTPSERN